MMQGGTIVQRKAGTFIPNEYLEKVLAANPNCWGAATVKDGELHLNSGEEGTDLEFIQDAMKVWADQGITFYFGHADAALNTADIPPYILVIKKDGEEEVPQIVGFFDGNFPAYDKGGSSHPPEYHLAVDYLIPKLEGLWDTADGDIDKVTAQLQKPYFKKELLLTSVSRGTITLVCANGVALTFAQSDLSGEFPWGWVSNTHGYKTEAVKMEEPVKPKRSMFDGKSTVREKVGATQPDNVTEATKQLQAATGGFPRGAVNADKLAEATAAAKTDTAVKGYSVKKWKPDAGASRSQKKDQYKMRIGHLPTGWKDSIEVDVYYNPEGKIMTFAQVKALGMEAAKVMALAKNPPAEKDTEPHEVRSENTRPTEKAITAEVLPVMSPDTREHIKAMMKDPAVQKIIAENADIIEDPAKVQAIEAKFADFARQLGEKSIDAFIPWSYEMMLELGKTRPEGLAVMCWTYRNIVASHRTKKAEAAVAKVEDAPPKKRSMFDKVA